MADYGAERRTTVEMLPPFLHTCRLFAESPAGVPLSATDLAAHTPPALDVSKAQKLVSLLVDVGFLRPLRSRHPPGTPVAPAPKLTLRGECPNGCERHAETLAIRLLPILILSS